MGSSNGIVTHTKFLRFVPKKLNLVTLASTAVREPHPEAWLVSKSRFMGLYSWVLDLNDAITRNPNLKVCHPIGLSRVFKM